MLHSLTGTPVTKQEAALFAVAKHVGFGEVLEVDLPDAPLNTYLELTQQQKDILRALRALDVQYFDRITVHNGVPSQAEVRGEYCGMRYQRKIRFENK